MSIHCESTSRNHRTELPYEHWEQHHCTGRSQPCSLCNTNHYSKFQFLTSHQLPSLSILHESVIHSRNIRSPCPIPGSIFCKDYTGTWVCFDIPSQDYQDCQVSARLVPFDELKQRNLSGLLRLSSFLMLVKQQDPSTNTLLPVLQSKFGSAESEPFVHFQRMKPRTITTGNMNGCFLTWN